MSKLKAGIIGAGRIKSPELVRKLYWTDGMTQRQIAQYFSMRQTAISRYMQKAGIKTRSKSEIYSGERNPFYGKTHSETVRRRLSEQRRIRLSISKEELKRLYLVEKKSTREIGKELGCSDKVVRSRLKEIGVQIRDVKTALSMAVKWYNNPSLRPEVRAKLRRNRTGKATLAPLHYIDSPNHRQGVVDVCKSHQTKGYRCIPLIDVIPDALAIKGNEILAIEVDKHRSDYDKYSKTACYDDVLWFRIKKMED